ncbi:MAG TPA: phosphoglucosamine mutase [Bacteroidota bacterium]
MVSISGIRGIVGSSLTPEVVVNYASAFAEYCKRGPIVIGRDGRITGRTIGHIVSSTLLQMGCDVTALGVCPTPTVALAVEKTRAAGGISITASHNPMQWNGLKFFSRSGLFLDGAENRDFWNIADRVGRTYVPWNKQGNFRTLETFLDDHIKTVLSSSYIRPEIIRRRHFKVVLDCVNAAGGRIVPKLLKELGCDVVEMNCDVSGVFSHTPEPIPENLADLCKRVKREKADIGIAVDPDVDRLVLINEKGEPFGEEYTIASVVKFVLQKESGVSTQRSSRNTKPVVVNLSTTRAVDDIAGQFGVSTVRTPVGEINVAKKMKEIGAIVGGEGSGGVILSQVHLGRDAIVGIALTLQHLAEFGGSVSALKASMPEYYITKGKVELGKANPDKVLAAIKDTLAVGGTINEDDGLKIDYPDSWIHLRKSNTEPIVRIIAEARDKKAADRLVEKFTKAIRTVKPS